MTTETSQVNINELVAIKNRVQSFDDALRITGKTFLVFDGEDPDDTARRKAKIITEALNTAEDGNVWIADYTNYNQVKYYVYGYKYIAGSGFSAFDYVYAYSRTHVGSRFAFASSDLAQYAAATFPEIYNEMLK